MHSPIKHSPLNIKKGFTMIELLVAIGIFSIFITVSAGVLGNVYLTQKRINLTQAFYGESQFLMERINRIIRENTIDYDRYFVEIGPPSGCTSFEVEQIPCPLKDDGTYDCTAKVEDNTPLLRETLGYENFFYWDTNGDGIPDRALGGYNPLDGGSNDLCTLAFDKGNPIRELYLINADRTMRTAIRRSCYNSSNTPLFSPNNCTPTVTQARIEIQRQFGADTDEDGIADVWGPSDVDEDGTYDLSSGDVEQYWNDSSSNCEVKYQKNSTEGEKTKKILGHEITGQDPQDYCESAHDWTAISPKAIKVTKLTFEPSPDRDPFLNFRVDSARVHPHIFVYLEAEFIENKLFTFFTDSQNPEIYLQTAVSSRVFGNTRE